MGAFLVVAIVVAILCHRIVREMLIASLASGFISAIAFQVVVWIDLGYMDPFAPLAYLITLPIGFAVAVGVGWVMRVARGQPSHAVDAGKGANSADDH